VNVLYIKVRSAFISEDKSLVTTLMYGVITVFLENIEKRFFHQPRRPSSPNTPFKPFGKEIVLILKVDGVWYSLI
jgi:hypothetical protein